MLFAEHAQIGHRDLLGRLFRNKPGHYGFLGFTNRCLPCGVGKHAIFVALQHFIGRRCRAPVGFQLGHTQNALGLLAHLGCHDQCGHTLAPGTTRPARAVQQGFMVGR